MDSAEIIQRLAAVDSASLCDAHKSLQGTRKQLPDLRVPDPGIRPLRPGRKMVGAAHTVRCHNDFLAVIKGLKDSEAGDVLVVDSQGSQRAVAGGLFPTEGQRKGLAGIVIDGPCRDTATVTSLDIPYYARCSTPYAGTTTSHGETQIPVSLGGVTVNPGDIVFGDDDGLVVASAEDFETLLPIAESIVATEAVMMQRMNEQGISLLDMLNLDEHWTALDDGSESSLAFRV